MANLTRWDPFAEMVSLQDRLNRLLNQSFGNPSPFSFGRESERQLAGGNFVPPVDVYEDDHTISLQAELPGMEEKDLDIRLENNILTISGERKFEKEDRQENFHRIERQYGRFSRSFTLPSAVDAEKIRADFENGILHITMPKSEEARPKQIKIGSGQGATQAIKPGKAA